MSPKRLDDRSGRTRRRVLQSAGATAIAALAGCSSGSDGATTSDETTAGTTAEVTATETTATETRQTTTDPAAQRERAIKLVQRLGGGEYETAFEMLSANVRSQYSASRLQSDWEQTVGDFGRFEGISGTTRDPVGGYDRVVVQAQFEAGVLGVQVVFDGTAIEGLQFVPLQQAYSPPGYADQSAFEERELSLQSPACDLGAVLTTPTDGSDAGVVLVHGSGPNDRDETIGPNKPFKDLAWGLATEGVTVLRYDKRTYACDVATADLGFDALVVDDALTALGRLRDETGVSRTAVVGHSLGAYAAPKIAKKDGGADAFLLAAASRPLYELVPEQLRYLAQLDGETTDAERERIEQAETTAQRLASGDYEDGGFDWGASFWRDVADYEPVATAESLSADVYALQGGRDYQVSPERDFPAWRDALGDDYTRRYESLNHLFIAGEGEPNPNEYFEPGSVDEAVVSDLAGWLAE
ncbi:alpha/beta fold hydrolase [Halobacterium bonnevillei]|uniref:Alpha/beta fold hydrolase n=1 Tax=Halobacterium bonnevillei TaxID=2692200 RepID=A0A6B0SK47_9EURY|nr:alpha/beta fold hydrolase [Halobacterium bonnevillei]MXR20131.1 alpha/beta fold hydrolase [Halobacterium bonnevillei]